MPSSSKRDRVLRWAAWLEATAACLAVAADLAVPSFVLGVMALASLLVRRQGWSSLGFQRSETPHLVRTMLVFAAMWSAFQFAVTMPIANHVSGRKQDLSDFDDLRGNVGALVLWIALGWIVGALVEEVAYRGYLQTRMREALGPSAAALAVTVLVSSVLFGRVHSEQGAIGMFVVTLDAIAWSVLRYRHGTVWASVLAHGFNNTIGFITFFLLGPVHGLW